MGKEEDATEEDKAYGIDYWAKLFKATTWKELKTLAQNQTSLQSTIETMYRVSADEYTREEIRAREEEIRLQRTIQSVHAKELKERDDIITAQNAEIERLRAEIATLKQQTN